MALIAEVLTDRKLVIPNPEYVLQWVNSPDPADEVDSNETKDLQGTWSLNYKFDISWVIVDHYRTNDLDRYVSRSDDVTYADIYVAAKDLEANVVSIINAIRGEQHTPEHPLWRITKIGCVCFTVIVLLLKFIHR